MENANAAGKSTLMKVDFHAATHMKNTGGRIVSMADLNTMYRIIVLYMLSRVEFPLTNTQITNFILEKDYTDYFTTQQAISDLLSSGLITAESTHSNTRYRITENGDDTLRLFIDKISPGIMSDISSYFREHHYELRQETSVYADYYKAADSGYSAHCVIKNLEKPVLDLTITVPTKEQARSICSNWEKEHPEVYTVLMDHLLK
ncbi:MAG: DUF4364 family protein [Clostridiales bacterium]|nr:DUF4364 family protein [Clostridiales bacterium]